MLYWDTTHNRAGFNDGPNGLQKLDFLVSEAAKRNLKLIVAFLDFWSYTGGAQQMRAWYGSEDKGTFFFSDPRTKQDYKDWVRHVLTRVNPLTKIAYKDDPNIFAWELMNEPNIEPASLYIEWVSEMSAYVKSIDRNHLVSSGHANFANKLSDLPISSIDFGTWHGYPQYENLPADTYDRTIREFCEIGRDNNKPVLLEEFGYPRFKPDQAGIYQKWLDAIQQDPDCAGWLVWRLVSRQASGRYPADTYDGFDVHRKAARRGMSCKRLPKPFNRSRRRRAELESSSFSRNRTGREPLCRSQMLQNGWQHQCRFDVVCHDPGNRESPKTVPLGAGVGHADFEHAGNAEHDSAPSHPVRQPLDRDEVILDGNWKCDRAHQLQARACNRRIGRIKKVQNKI